MRNIFDENIRVILNERLKKLEKHFDSDVIFYYGEIHPSLEKGFRDFIEELKKDTEFNRNRLTIILNTPGGSAETVEKMVDIIRYHYNEVNFVVPDYAMSAGTIFCMSGDKIYMDYSSSLGPIDPQVYNGKKWVPALGYLDKVEELIKKSADGILTEAEFLILQKIDLAELRSYEMAKNLTVSLLKHWLVKYKFKNWNTHRKSKKTVTMEEKEKRAEDIAKLLGNNSLWHSHGRSIGISSLTTILKLKIDDYSQNSG
ncbi:ATP-dependent Clp protease proteolytic subunit [Fulvivirgaceae bacterium BMA12]|uniref:ATP-dependent Clp protease proteolytic subunit n=1 Tax=Agaribacillus aureus TaxID=3051825 RepID=A0ABT8LD50_9BACT|nr:ATP-dependent Clp protease proteolytic subunit [Fulvivirgaceae bacterium BMA12]